MKKFISVFLVIMLSLFTFCSCSQTYTESDIEDIKSEVAAEYESQIEELESDNAELQDKVDNLTEKNAKLQSKVKKLQSKTESPSSSSSSNSKSVSASSSAVSTDDSSPGGYTVYYTNTGGKYHASGCPETKFTPLYSQ